MLLLGDGLIFPTGLENVRLAKLSFLSHITYQIGKIGKCLLRCTEDDINFDLKACYLLTLSFHLVMKQATKFLLLIEKVMQCFRLS